MERQEAKPVLILSDVSRLEKALLEEAREKLLLHRKAQELERKLQNQRQNLQQVLRIAHDRQKETAQLRPQELLDRRQPPPLHRYPRRPRQ